MPFSIERSVIKVSLIEEGASELSVRTQVSITLSTLENLFLSGIFNGWSEIQFEFEADIPQVIRDTVIRFFEEHFEESVFLPQKSHKQTFSRRKHRVLTEELQDQS